MKPNQLKNELVSFGLNNTEASIYLCCIKLGALSVQEISDELHIKRTTIHSSVNQLLKKGILFESRRGKRRLILAEDPDVFSKLLKKKESELKKVKDSMDAVIKEISSYQTNEPDRPSIRYYKDISGFKKMLAETLSAKNEVYVFTYVELFSELLTPTYLENYFIQRAKKGIRSRLIFPPVDFAYYINQKSKEYKTQIRVLPKEFIWDSGIFSWSDCVSLKSFNKNKLTCTIVQNKSIASFYQNIVFELCWMQAKAI